jgi:hypothetical protein
MEVEQVGGYDIVITAEEFNEKHNIIKKEIK